MDKLYAEQVLNEGIDQSGEELVAMNGIDRLVNGEFRREGGIQRRKGFEAPDGDAVALVEPGKSGHTLVANSASLAVMRKLDCVNIDSSLNDGVNEDARSFALPGTVETAAQLRDGGGFTNANVAVARVGGVLLACVVGQVAGTEGASTTWRAVVVEADSGVLLSSSGYVTGQRPVPIAATSGSDVRFHVVYRTNGAADILVKSWASLTNSWTAADSLLDGEVASASTYPAVCPDPDSAARFYVAFADTGETEIHVRRVNFDHTISTFYGISVTEVQLVAMCPSLRPTGHLHFVYGLIGGASVRLIGNQAGGGTVTAEVVALTRSGASYSWRHLSVADLGDNSGSGTYGLLVAACETTGTFTIGDVRRRFYAYVLAGSPLMPSYTPGTEAADLNLYLLAEPAVLQPDDLAEDALDEAGTPGLFMSRITDVLATASRLTTTHSFLQVVPPSRWFDGTALGTDPRLGAAMLSGSSYNGAADDTNATYEQHRLSRVVYDATSHSYFVAALDLEEAPASGTLTYGIRVLRYRFSTYRADAQPLPRAQLGTLAYVGGNLLRCYDGHDVTEAGPYHPPHAPTLAAAASGSLTLLGTYVVQAVLVFEDAKGNVHRSAPSPAVSLTLSGANGTIEASFALDVFPHSRGSATSMRLEVYRTEADGTALYFDQALEVYEGTPVVVTIDQPDANVLENKLVYVTGNVLGAEAPPPSRALAAVGNRLFGISSVDPRTVFFSKELEEAIAAEFNSVLQLRLEASSSEPVTLGVLGDLLVMFTRDEAWAVSTHGGPDATGSGTFGLPQRLASDCGASSPEAAVSTPYGILVHGPSGFRMLASGGAVDVPAVIDIAGPGTEIVRSMHVPEREEAWFIVRGDATANRIVVFSYARGKIRWCTYEVSDGVAQSMRDMVNVRGTPWLLVESGISGANTYELRRLSTTSYHDGFSSVRPAWSVRTRWFKPEGHMADSRFWHVHVLGTYGEHDDLSADVYVMDVSGLPADDSSSTNFLEGEYVWTAAQLLTDDRLVHVRQRLKRQRGAAARVELHLEDGGAGDPTDRGPILHAVGWDYGARGGSASRGAVLGSAADEGG